MPSYFLGLDCSTQSLSSVWIDLESGQRLDERSLVFERDLPHYNTKNGVFISGDGKIVHSSPLMWAEALDLLFQGFQKDKLPLGELLAISGSGQQHGSVYLTANATDQFRDMDIHGSLADNVARVLSRPTAPVWMDHSTTGECNEIRKALGGREQAVQLTGSDVCERFTGPQIRRFFIEEPGAYRQTGHIALVSSFLSSLIAGQISPIDYGDGAGMNLMDIRRFTWLGQALEATADHLHAKLPPLAPSHTVLGVVNPYLVLKYKVNPSAKAVVWSGDNPCSLIGTGCVSAGQTAISLGTSDTLFGAMSACRADPRAEGHMMGSPAGDYMSLICFKNGSLARERIKDQFGLNWAEFSQALRDTPPGNNGKLMLPWFEEEIVPRAPAGVVRRELAEDDRVGNCRAVVEGQLLAMREHSAWMGDPPTRITATGGGSANREILQIIANVFNAPVVRQDTTNGAALGAALRAAHAWTVNTRGGADWEHIVRAFTLPDAEYGVDPEPEAVAVYDHMLPDYVSLESEHRHA